MNVREAINFGLNKLSFENIRENQRKVVEAYLSGRDVLMISPTGSGKSLTFHIASFAIDFFQHGERDDIQTVCLIIFPLVSLMNDQVSEGKYNPVFTSSEALFGSHRSTIPILKNKTEAVLIDEVHRVAKEGPIHLILTLLESYQLCASFRSAAFLLYKVRFCCLSRLSR